MPLKLSDSVSRFLIPRNSLHGHVPSSTSEPSDHTVLSGVTVSVIFIASTEFVFNNIHEGLLRIKPVSGHFKYQHALYERTFGFV